MSNYISYTLPITLEQAQEIIEARSNGGYEIDTQGIASPNGEWCLAELEAFIIKRRYEEQQPFKYVSFAHLGDAPQDPIFGYTQRMAEIAADDFLEASGSVRAGVSGMDAGKGGRAWMSGHWAICQLEALCAHLRYISDTGADGAIETLGNWLAMDIIDKLGQPQSEEDEAFRQSYYPLVNKMLYAGINPQTFPRVWEKFLEHKLEGWKLPRIVSAANEMIYRDQTGHIRKIIVAGARHCDQVMGGVSMALELRHGTLPANLPGTEVYVDEGQGFIDNFGNYWTRFEAWTIAEFHGQIVERMGWVNGRLHSENLY